VSTAPTKLVAALDLGSTKVTAVVAEAGGDSRRPTARVLGVGVERSNGVRRGVVRDIEEATRAITKALSDAQRMAGVEVGSVFLRTSPG
jgi:cell division protein FtsA